MTTDNWINIIAAILIGGGTLFLGIMAWRTIRQTRSIQKAEKKERLLNEIIEWAIDLIKSTHGQDISIVSLKDRDLITAIYYGFVQLSGRSKYIQHIASIFDGKLSKVIDEAIKTMESCMKIHVNWLKCSDKNKDEFAKATKEAVKKDLEVEKIANKVIEEATKIKARDIGQ